MPVVKVPDQYTPCYRYREHTCPGRANRTVTNAAPGVRLVAFAHRKTPVRLGETIPCVEEYLFGRALACLRL